MNTKFFHYLSYTSWIFYAWGIYTAFSAMWLEDTALISQIGFGVFLCGIALGLSSLSDSNKLSKFEIKTLSKAKYVKRQNVYVVITLCTTMVVGLFFLMIKYINPSLSPEKAIQYDNLAFGCMAMSLGMICELKQLQEKVRIVAGMHRIEGQASTLLQKDHQRNT